FSAQPALGIGEVSSIRLLRVRLTETQGHKEPLDEFDEQVQRGFQNSADWLHSRSPEAFEKCRKAGLHLHLEIEGWISNQKLDLTLPSELVNAWGLARLPISIRTNC